MDGGRRAGFALGQVRMMRMTSWRGSSECFELDWGLRDALGAL